MQAGVPVNLLTDLEVFPAGPFIDDSHKEIGLCKISHDGSWAWIIRNSILEIFSTHKVERKSYWSFRTEPKTSGISITSVTEFYSNASSPQLIIALDNVNFLCVFDVNSSTIIRAIQLPNKIESVEVIATRGGACIQTRPLAHELRYMFGIVAVAVEGGKILLVDLCLDEDEGFTNDTHPGKPFFTSFNTPNLSEEREAALNRFEHLTFFLNQEHFLRGNFLYKGAQGEVLTAFNSCLVSVTSLKYIPHLTILVVGFNFGGFQLWNLKKLLLEYSSSVDNDADSVVKFAFQEPENDPRNYCYLWVARGQSNYDSANSDITSVVSLYSLGYQKKEWIENYGFIYQGMQNCIHRLSYPLTTQPFAAYFNSPSSSRIINFRCIQQGEIINLTKADLEELHSDDFSNQDLSICAIVWESWTPTSTPRYFLALFDINQWYQAQMPSSIRFYKNEQCSYFGIFSLVEVQEKLSLSNLRDLHIHCSSFVKYKSLSGTDEMYFPSSLAFKAVCATDCGIINVSYLGTQRQILWEMEEKGPNSLIFPSDLYNLCVTHSLLPVSSEVASNDMLKREALLTLALNYNLLKFITSCIWHWASVDYSKKGLTLKFLLSWIWKRATIIKNSSDKICVPLFNYSGQELEQSSLSTLHSYASQLERLSSILKILHSQTGPITETGLQELQTRQEVTWLIATFLRVVLWLYYCNLLPEHAEGEAYGENEVSYPASTLLNTYNQRRKDLQLLHPSVGQTDLLLIDGMMTYFGDLPLQWERGTNNRLYPPPSLYAILGIYLVKGPTLEDKHCLMLYLLLDMAAFLSDKQSHLEEKLMKFPAAFKMSHSRVKLTQGFWMLDHRDFEEAILFFTDPVINPGDILPWQHIRIIKSFLYQGEHQKALKYIQICKPSLHTPEEVKIHLTVLLANKLIVEAFQYQRQCCDERNTEDLLTHFFLGCQQTGNMDALLQLPFSALEEEALINFLFNSRESFHKDLLVMYFLQRSHLLEAAHVNDRIKSLLNSDNQTKERGSIRSCLVLGFLQTLPEMQSKLASEVAKHHVKMTSNFKNVEGPAPLSTKIHRNTVNVISQSSRLCEFMSRVKDTWAPTIVVQQSPLKSNKQETTVWRSEGIPFIETPGTNRKSKKSDCEVVFATPLAKRKISFDFSDVSKLSAKKIKGMDHFACQSKADSEKRSHRPLSAEVLSLLQTPPVKRVIPPLKARTLERAKLSMEDTPPSILKVRQMIKRSATPPNIPINVSRTLSFPDVLETDDTSDSSDLNKNDDDAAKNLRFEIPGTVSTTGSDWSSTPEMMVPDAAPEKAREVPNSPLQSSLKNRLNATQVSTNSSVCGISLHNSDDVIDVDEDITINLTIQKRRDLTLIRDKLDIPKRVSQLETIPKESVSSIKERTVPVVSFERDPLPSIPKNPSPLSVIPKKGLSPLTPLISQTSSVSIFSAAFDQKSSSKLRPLPLNVLRQEMYRKSPPLKENLPSASDSFPEVNDAVGSELIPSPRPQITRSPLLKTTTSLEPVEYDIVNIGEDKDIQDIGEDEDMKESDNNEDELRISESEELENIDADEKFQEPEQIFELPITPSPIGDESDADEGIEDNGTAPPESCTPPSVVASLDSDDEHSVSDASEVFASQVGNKSDDESLVKSSEPDAQECVIKETTELGDKSVVKYSEPIMQQLTVKETIQLVDESVRKSSELKKQEFSVEETTQVVERPNISVLGSSTGFAIPSPALPESSKSPKFNFSFIKTASPGFSPINELPLTLLKKKVRSSSVVSFEDESILEKSIQDAKSLLSEAFEVAQVIGDEPAKSKRIAKVKSLSSLEKAKGDASAEEKPKLTRQTRSLRSRKELKSEDDSSVSSSPRKEKISQKETKTKLTKGSKALKEVTDNDSSLILRSSKVVSKGIINKLGSKKITTDVFKPAPSPTISEASSSVFATPEKQTSPEWAPRLRPRARTDSGTSLELSPPNIAKELAQKTKARNVKSVPENPIPETSMVRKNSRRGKKNDLAQDIIPEDSVIHIETPSLEPQATALPFVFSPPSTRSRARRQKSDSFSEQSSLYEAHAAAEQLNQGEASYSKSKKSGPIPPWECFINVISPPSVEHVKETKKTRSSSASSLTSKHGMQLRKGPFKTRKKVKL